MSLAYATAQTWTSGSSGSGPRARIQTMLRGSRSPLARAHGGSPAYRISTGRSRVDRSGRPSGSGASGIGTWCSRPVSGRWNDADSVKMAWPCWIAVTRRVLNERPSRVRSTV